MAALLDMVNTTEVELSQAIFFGPAGGKVRGVGGAPVPHCAGGGVGFRVLQIENSSMSLGEPKAIPARRRKPILSVPNSVNAMTVPLGDAAIPNG